MGYYIKKNSATLFTIPMVATMMRALSSWHTRHPLTSTFLEKVCERVASSLSSSSSSSSSQQGHHAHDVVAIINALCDKVAKCPSPSNFWSSLQRVMSSSSWLDCLSLNEMISLLECCKAWADMHFSPGSYGVVKKRV